MLYIFDHIFKTGGTTFTQAYLPGAFRHHGVFVLRGSEDGNRADLRGMMNLPENLRKRMKVIAGHNVDALRPYYPDARFLTLVRNPVERGISAYLHARYHDEARERNRIQETNMSLGEFMQADGFGESPNVQARIVLTPQRAGDGPTGEAEITDIIRSRYYLAGYTEALELFLFYLHATEGFPLVLFNNKLVRKERAWFRPAAEDLAIVERCNQLDAAVYRSVRMEFDRKVAQIWDDERERLFAGYTNALKRFREKTRGNPMAEPVRWSSGPRGFASTLFSRSKPFAESLSKR